MKKLEKQKKNFKNINAAENQVLLRNKSQLSYKKLLLKRRKIFFYQSLKFSQKEFLHYTNVFWRTELSELKTTKDAETIDYMD